MVSYVSPFSAFSPLEKMVSFCPNPASACFALQRGSAGHGQDLWLFVADKTKPREESENKAKAFPRTVSH